MSSSKSKSAKCIILILLISVLLHPSLVMDSNAQKQSNASNKSALKLDQLISTFCKSNEPGVSVAVIKDGDFVYKFSKGMSNLEYDIPITSSTVFHIASVSKQFTMFAILLLEQEGKLSIDDDIRKYFPEMADYGDTIRLRHLANHTSGIRDIFDLTNLIGIRNEDMISNDQTIKLITCQKGLNFKPGEKYEYCNSGYILLAEIVKRVSGMSFADFTTSKIFKPLKMMNSQFLDFPELIIKNRAYSYFKQDTTYYKSLLNFSFVGSSGLNTSTEDLSLWAMNFENKNVGSDIIFNKMKERGKLNNGELIPYALGQELKSYKGLDIVFHGGGDAGYRSYLLRVPKHKFSIAILSNSQEFNPLDIAYEIVDFYLKDVEVENEETKLELKIDQSILKNFVGYYEVLPGFIFSITQEKSLLYLQMVGDTPKVLLPQINRNEFVYPNMPHSKFVFSERQGAVAKEFKLNVSDFVYDGKRIQVEKFDQTKINLSELTGQYFSADVNTIYHFVIRENKLFATHHTNTDIQLKPLQPDQFIGGMSFFGQVDMIRDQHKKVIGFYLSGQKSKRIKFDKMCE